MADQDINNIKRQNFGPKLGQIAVSLPKYGQADGLQNSSLPPIDPDGPPAISQHRIEPQNFDTDELELADQETDFRAPNLPPLEDVQKFNSKAAEIFKGIAALNKKIFLASGKNEADFDPNTMDPRVIQEHVATLCKLFVLGIHNLEQISPRYFKTYFTGAAPIEEKKLAFENAKETYTLTSKAENALKAYFQNDPSQLRQKFDASIKELLSQGFVASEAILIASEDIFTDATGRNRLGTPTTLSDGKKEPAKHMSLKERTALGNKGAPKGERRQLDYGVPKKEETIEVAPTVPMDERSRSEVNAASYEESKKEVESQDKVFGQSLVAAMKSRPATRHRLYGQYSAKMNKALSDLPDHESKISFEDTQIGAVVARMKELGDFIFRSNRDPLSQSLPSMAEAEASYRAANSEHKPYAQVEQNLVELSAFLRLADYKTHLSESHANIASRMAPSVDEIKALEPSAEALAQREKEETARAYNLKLQLVAEKLVADNTIGVIKNARDIQKKNAIALKLAEKYLKESDWKPTLEN